MCRSIRPLFNYDPPATGAEIHASSLQYVRKVTGFRKPSRTNEPAFEFAVRDIARITQELLGALVTDSPPRSRAREAERARARAQQRFGDAAHDHPLPEGREQDTTSLT
jgi:hypothetical protein